MSNQDPEPDLVSLERAIFRRTLNHGLFDIAIGCAFSMFALGPYASAWGLGDFWASAVFVPFWGLVASILWFVHRRLVVPRLGHVTFARRRKKRLVTWNMISVGVGVLAFVVGLISCSAFGLIPPIVHAVAVGLAVFAGFALAGYYLELRRLYLYGVVICAAPLTGELLWKYGGVPHHGFPVTFGFAAALCLFVGVGLLVRFTSRHPLPPREADSGGA